MGDPCRCASCASYQPVAGDPLGRRGCSNRDARMLGASPVPLPDFGCLFWSARDPAAYKAQVIETALQVLYANLRSQAGRTKLPDDVNRLDWRTLLVLEATALRLVQALGLLS